MDIRTLQYFLAVAREESISGAAEFLHTAFYPREPQNNADGRWYDPAQKSRRNRCSNGKNQS